MLRDLRIAVRTLRSWRWGATAAVLTLAIGIGATTSLYALLRAALSDSAPQIEDVARVARIYASNPTAGVERTPVTFDDFTTLLSNARSFESIAAWTRAQMATGAAPEAEALSVTHVSASYFAVLRARAMAGRLFTAADFGNTPPTALVSEAVWQRRFGGRPLTDGVTIRLDGIERQVVGVVPAAFEFSFIGIGGDAWLPLTAGNVRRDQAVFVIARLGPEHTWAGASAELLALTPAAQRASAWTWRAIPVPQDSRYRTVGATTMTLLPALVILVIGCVNVACMLLARGIERDTELSVRCALGASRGAILRQLLLENVVLAVVAGTIGAGIAAGMMKLALALILPVKPFLAPRLTADLGLLPIALASSFVACILFGTWPALRLSRRDIASSLKGVAPLGRARVAGYGARDLVVFVELGLAVVLVAVTAMWFSFFSVLQHATFGFPAGQVISHRVGREDATRVAARIAGVPGVTSTTVSSRMPGGDRSAVVRADNGRVARASVVGVGDAFFETLGLPVVRGRGFDATERGPGARVAVVSESAAAALWPREEALGRSLIINSGAGATPLTVIGVSRNAVEFGGLGILTAGDVYRPLEDGRAAVILLARAHDARAALRSIGAALRPTPSAPIPELRIVGDMFQSTREPWAFIRLFGGLAFIALLLAASGVFAVITQSVAQRTTEFGVRMALGASRAGLLRMVFVREGKLIAAALACALVGTVLVTRIVFVELVTISARNPGWPIGWLLLCGTLAMIAVGVASYRILRLEPSEVLRKA